MSRRFLVSVLAVPSAFLFILRWMPAPVAGQTKAKSDETLIKFGSNAGRTKWARDFKGEWSPTGVGGGQKYLLPGNEISFTKLAAEQFNKIDEADSPAYRCEPYGPTRMMTSALPFRIFPQENVIGMIFEHIDYRIIYMNAKHPDDIVDYPEWAGHSIGRWDGDTLVVDTIGMREESWLDSGGLQHSGKLHVVERWTKTSPDTFVILFTIEDPDYYTKPFTYGNNYERNDFRIVPDRCEDTPPDDKYIRIKGKVGPTTEFPVTYPPHVPRAYVGAEEATAREARRAAASPPVKKTKFEEDVIKTSAGDLKITSISNYSLQFAWNGKIVDVDPVGRAADYSQMPKADVILLTHPGADHIDPATIKTLSTDKTSLVVCPHCWMYAQNGTIMINGETEAVDGLKIEAVPAYNIKGQLGNGKPNTSKGSANGYVITFADKRIYVAGETENVPEAKGQKQIEVAFLPVNNKPGPAGGGLRTMTQAMFVETVNSIKPKIVFPYAYGNNDPKELATLVKDPAIETRVRDMK